MYYVLILMFTFVFSEDIFVFKDTALDNLILKSYKQELLKLIVSDIDQITAIHNAEILLGCYHHLYGIRMVLSARNHKDNDTLPPCFHPCYDRHSVDVLEIVKYSYHRYIQMLCQSEPQLQKFQDLIENYGRETAGLKAAVYDCYDPEDKLPLRRVIPSYY
jgi:hypothetical protein